MEKHCHIMMYMHYSVNNSFLMFSSHHCFCTFSPQTTSLHLGNSCGVNILCARQRLFCKRHIQSPETVWINCIIPLFCSVLEPYGQWWHFNNRDTVHYSAAPTLCLVCCALVWGVLLWVQSKLAHNTQKLNHFKIRIQCFFMYKVVDLTESLDHVRSLLFYILFLFDWCSCSWTNLSKVSSHYAISCRVCLLHRLCKRGEKNIVSVSPVRVVTAAISQLVELEAMVLSVDDSQAI